MGFSKDFVWGVATSSYQIEGAAFEDGKGACIWDTMTAEKGRIDDGTDGLVACDHYHLYKDDVALMAKLGVKNYRFSINWARVLPEGTGAVSEKGLQFYSDLVDCLLENGVEPYVTLYHWELPTAIHYKGGFLNEELPNWFADYVEVVARKLGDRVKHYFTINEPQCVIGLGHGNGVHAPGIIYPVPALVRMSHMLMKAHGMAVERLRAVAPHAEVGYAPTSSPISPATTSKADIETARQAYFSLPDDQSSPCWNAAWFSDPVMFGAYSDEALSKYGQWLPKNYEKDMATIGQPIDIYAQNIYNGKTIRFDETKKERYSFVPRKVGMDKTAIDWPITPEAIYWGSKFLYERYQKPIIITENGMSAHDVVSLDGQVHDPNRIDFLHRYLLELRRAATDGVDIRGYFQWSLMDNFEWARGYQERFGMVFVDFETQKRTVKDSALWYQQVMQTNGEQL